MPATQVIMVASARGLAEFLLADDHLLLHEDNLHGVDGVVDEVDVKASPGRLDFLTVGE